MLINQSFNWLPRLYCKYAVTNNRAKVIEIRLNTIPKRETSIISICLRLVKLEHDNKINRPKPINEVVFRRKIRRKYLILAIMTTQGYSLQEVAKPYTFVFLNLNPIPKKEPKTN